LKGKIVLDICEGQIRGCQSENRATLLFDKMGEDEMAILVTGGTKGIGLEIAKAFAAPGEQVFLNYHSDAEAAARAEQAITSAGAICHLIRADAGTPEGCGEIAAQIAEKTDRLDQVVHCAVDAYASPALTADPHRFTQAAITNGMSLLFLVQSVLPLLTRGSTVFFLTSRGGRIVVENYAAIGVGKSMSESMVRYLATELAPRGIRINCIAPSIVETDAVRTLFGSNVPKLMEHAAHSNPTGRAVQSKDYTALMKFLASPEAEFVTGQIVFVNGGANLSA
jgi:enoyl-[acyl-carrier protein] reductase III